MKHGAPPVHRTAKTVAVAFFLSLVAFCAVLLLPVFLGEKTPITPKEADASRGRAHTTVLFFRDTVDTLTGAVILVADTRTMTVRAMGYPPDTVVGDVTLNEAYQSGGTSYAQTLLCRQAQMEGDGALSFSVSSVAAFLIYLRDRLPCTLPEPVGVLPAGESTLTPMQVADILRHDDWSTGADGQAQIHAQVVAAIINRYLTSDRDLEADFHKLTELCDDRLNISQFVAVQDDLEALAKANNGSLCSASAAT